jgi:hypothetical protein
MRLNVKRSGRYRFIVGDGRRELMLSQEQFDLI